MEKIAGTEIDAAERAQTVKKINQLIIQVFSFFHSRDAANKTK